MNVLLKQGDCRTLLKELPDNSVDSVITDPPYELAFMGKKWDASGIAYNVDMWKECLRVLKPGGHLLAFGGTRTHHRMTCAIEDAGFEIRDELDWLYSSGFPKSLDVSKVIDKQAGHTRASASVPNMKNKVYGKGMGGGEWGAPSELPITEAAKQWNGWGTALKPAHEPIVLARKPLVVSVAENLQTHGTGALNIDATRIAGEDVPINKLEAWSGFGQVQRPDYAQEINSKGRWPANVILDEYAAAELDAQSGETNSGDSREDRGTGGIWHKGNGVPCGPQYGDNGGASRFFYVAKASRTERELGCEHLPTKSAGEATGGRTEGSDGLNSPRAGAGRTSEGVHNFHPTVKPILLMQYLCLLITPPGGIVLGPLMGSGSTGCGCVQEGFRFIGFDLEAEHVDISKARIAYWTTHKHKIDTPLGRALDARNEASLF